ncbi:MAG: hypothetical protein AMXMBFR84_37690 [Candidatus Hydrogenedentota bacterium]
MKRGTFNHPKTGHLARLLGVCRAAAGGYLEAMWHWTAEFTPAGDIGRYRDSEIAEGAFWPPDQASEIIAAMIESRWLDACETHRIIVHDWPEHCEDTVHSRLTRSGQTFANGEQPKKTKLSQRERHQVDRCRRKTAAVVRTTAENGEKKPPAVAVAVAVAGPLPPPMPEPLPEPEADARANAANVSAFPAPGRSHNRVENSPDGAIGNAVSAVVGQVSESDAKAFRVPGDDLLARCLALEQRVGNSERTLWQRRLLEIRKARMANQFERLLEEAENRLANERIVHSKGYTDRLKSPAAWLNAESRKLLNA